MTNRSGTILRRSSSVCLGLLFALLLAEMILRGLPAEHYVWPPGLEETLTPDPGILPGIDGPSRFIVDSQGFRGDEPPAGDAYRILAVGGSTTECLYLDHEEAWPHLLQEILIERVGREVWVGNAGKSGRNTIDHLFLLERVLPEHPELDAVILLLGVNDLHRELTWEGRAEPYDSEDLRSRNFALIEERRGIVSLLRGLRENPEPASLMGRYYEDPAGRMYRRWRENRAAASEMRPTLPDISAGLFEYGERIRKIIGLCREHGVRPILATQPALWRDNLSEEEEALLWAGGIGDFMAEPGRPYYTAGALSDALTLFNATLGAAASDSGAEWIDLAAALPSDTSVFYDDVHFNEGGARLVAEEMAAYLLDQPPLFVRTP